MLGDKVSLVRSVLAIAIPHVNQYYRVEEEEGEEECPVLFTAGWHGRVR